MSIHIGGKRIDKPLLSALETKSYKFDGLTCNNIIICNSASLAQDLMDSLMSLNETESNVIMGLWDENLVEMSDEEFTKELYNPENHLDKLLVQREFDKIWIYFKNYAVQNFYITNCPSVALLAEKAEDIWFVSREETIPLAVYKNYDEIFKDKQELVKRIREGRFLHYN